MEACYSELILEPNWIIDWCTILDIDVHFFQLYRQKLRGAVYDALSNLGVTEHDPLFKPAFKKLFDIVSVYAKDMPKNTASTKQWLGVVAKQNATTVINLERALRTK